VLSATAIVGLSVTPQVSTVGHHQVSQSNEYRPVRIVPHMNRIHSRTTKCRITTTNVSMKWSTNKWHVVTQGRKVTAFSRLCLFATPAASHSPALPPSLAAAPAAPRRQPRDVTMPSCRRRYRYHASTPSMMDAADMASLIICRQMKMPVTICFA